MRCSSFFSYLNDRSDALRPLSLAPAKHCDMPFSRDALRQIGLILGVGNGPTRRVRDILYKLNMLSADTAVKHEHECQH